MPRAEVRHWYDYIWQTVIRPAVLARDFYECVRCGMPDRSTGWKSALHVAHLDGNPANRDWDNLATLCPRCHRAHDMPVWGPQYAVYIRRRREERIALLDAERRLLQVMLQEAS